MCCTVDLHPDSRRLSLLPALSVADQACSYCNDCQPLLRVVMRNLLHLELCNIKFGITASMGHNAAALCSLLPVSVAQQLFQGLLHVHRRPI